VPVDPVPSFAQLGIAAPLVRVLDRAKITTPTPVQAAVIPDAAAGRDVLGRAATGSGKTLAFGLPVLGRLVGGRRKPKSPRGLIVVPTRELATQVRASLDPLADALGLRLVTVYGGSPYDRQIKRLRHGADLVVATPGRLQDLVARGACRLDHVEIAVLDEADHLCDLGFFPAVSEIVSMTKPGGQRMLLSATLDGDVDRLVKMHLHGPVTHICNDDADQPDLDHHVLVIDAHNKIEAATSLLRANPRSIVFTRTRLGATRLALDLAERGVSTVDLHGNLSQGARERNLRKFRSGQADVVVATDVAARGIHVDGISVVVHYDAPTEHKSYVHRSGRTARAGSSGAVVTMTTRRQLGAVAGLHKAAGVAARHHDARTAPDPMTAAALALTGETADRRPAAPAPPSRPSRAARPRGSGRPSSESRSNRPRTPHSGTARSGTARSGSANPSIAESTQPSSGGSRSGATGPDERRRQPADRRADVRRLEATLDPVPAQVSRPPERSADVRTAPHRPAGTRGSGKARPKTKARWTSAQRRAGSKR